MTPAVRSITEGAPSFTISREPRGCLSVSGSEWPLLASPVSADFTSCRPRRTPPRGTRQENVGPGKGGWTAPAGLRSGLLIAGASGRQATEPKTPSQPGDGAGVGSRCGPSNCSRVLGVLAVKAVCRMGRTEWPRPAAGGRLTPPRRPQYAVRLGRQGGGSSWRRRARGEVPEADRARGHRSPGSSIAPLLSGPGPGKS